MNINIFKPNEIVQVLDVTSIWEEARIMGVISDWSVKIKWMHWNDSPVTITIPESLREQGFEGWNVRKAQYKADASETGQRPRRQAKPLSGDYRAFTGNPRKLTGKQEVMFC